MRAAASPLIEAGGNKPDAFRGRQRAFTLLELLSVILIIAILLVMLLPVYHSLESRMARTKCMANLKNIHIAATLYLQEHRSWPQIRTAGTDRSVVATAWIARFQPYGLDQISWICPTMQHQLNGPNLADHENVRIDYTPMPFDPNPLTPNKWPTQPWFVENGNMHGNGNLLIFPDGHIQELNEFAAAQGPATAP